MGTKPGGSEGAAGTLGAIQDACRRHASGLVVCLVDGSSVHGMLISADDAIVEVVLSSPPRAGSLVTGSACLISFNDESGMRAFLTHVRGFRPSEENAVSELLVDTPRDSLSMEARSLFRVPLLDGHGLEVCIYPEAGDAIHGRPINISMGGIAIDCGDEAARLRTGSAASIDLRLQGTAHKFAAVPRHEESGSVGFSFAAAEADSRDLAPIVKALERHWLRHRPR